MTSVQDRHHLDGAEGRFALDTSGGVVDEAQPAGTASTGVPCWSAVFGVRCASLLWLVCLDLMDGWMTFSLGSERGPERGVFVRGGLPCCVVKLGAPCE